MGITVNSANKVSCNLVIFNQQKWENRNVRNMARVHSKDLKPVHSKGDQSWDFFAGNDAKAETPVLWPPHAKRWLIGKDSDAGRDWGQEEKGTTEDEMAGWHHRLDGREFEWTPGVGDGQGGLACCDSWGRKESDMTEKLNWTDGRCSHLWENIYIHIYTHIYPYTTSMSIQELLFKYTSCRNYWWVFAYFAAQQNRAISW